MKRILVVFLLFTAVPAFAQDPGERLSAEQIQQELQRTRGRGPGRGRGFTPADNANAQETQQRLQELLREYPPSLSNVLALDPTLLANDGYLQTYPKLSTFVAQHPEIAHNPSYYFDQQIRDMNRRDVEDSTSQAYRALDQIMGGVAAMIMGLAAMFSVVWIIRSVIEHRKWLRVSKTHMETHAKIMDRLTSNDELIAYMQSPAGKKFLEAAPIPLEGPRRTLSAPFGRILWSLQSGLVVGALGIGTIIASERLAARNFYSIGGTPLMILGIALLAVGIGFFVSAVASYGLSSRLGLFEPRSTDSGSSHVS